MNQITSKSIAFILPALLILMMRTTVAAPPPADNAATYYRQAFQALPTAPEDVKAFKDSSSLKIDSPAVQDLIKRADATRRLLHRATQANAGKGDIPIFAFMCTPIHPRRDH